MIVLPITRNDRKGEGGEASIVSVVVVLYDMWTFSRVAVELRAG